MLYSFAHVNFFFFFFFFFLFFPPLLSGPYLWNRYSQRLQIECAAWCCCLISDPHRGCFMGFPEFIFFSFFFFFPFFYFFFRHDLVQAISLEPSPVEALDSVCCLVLQSNFALLLTIKFASLFFIFIFFLFFCQDFVQAISLELSLVKTLDSVCCLVLRSNFALLLTIHSLCYFFFSARFCHNFVRAISLKPLLAETQN